MAANYPDWAQTWADYYHMTPQELMANVGQRNPYENQINPDQQLVGDWAWQHRGFDIDPATGRRGIDTFINPNGTPEGDINMQWVPGPNTGPQNFMERLVAYGAPAALGAMAGYGALGAAGMLGSEALGGGGAALGSAPGEAAGAFSGSALPATSMPLNGVAGSWGFVDPALASLPAGSWAGVPGVTSAAALPGGGGMAPGATTVPSAGGGGGGIKAPSSWGDLSNLFKNLAPIAGAATGGGGSSSSGSSNGSLIGGLLGAGLGYLDARNQPNDITVTQNVDPYLRNIGITTGTAAGDLMMSQLGQPNPLTQAGQNISGMPALPGWGSLVADSQKMWNPNSWVKDLQQSTTDLVNRNFKENVVPAIGGSAVQAGGYGGSRQGIAEGLAASRLNQDLAPTIAKLGYDAYDSSQNRALAGAQGAANYGLNSQNQQANIWKLGADLQANGAWNPINNMANVVGRLPGNSSTTTPLFVNPIASGLGGAQIGSQVGGSVNWDELMKGIGGLLGGNWGGLFNNNG